MVLLTYDSNNTSGDTVGYQMDVGAVATIKECEFKTDGYEFNSWNTTADGTGVPYSPGDTLIVSANTTLYAVWKIHNFGQLIVNGVDISDMVLHISSEFGKNQPFSIVEVQIIKQLFNDTSAGGYWDTRKVIEPTISRPTMIQGVTPVQVDIYGVNSTWVFQKIDNDTDDYFQLLCVNPAHIMKNLKMSSLCNFKIVTSTTAPTLSIVFNYLNATVDLSNITPVPSSDATINRYTFHLIDSVGFDLTFVLANPINPTTSNLTPSLESVSGTGESFFRFFAKYTGGYTLSTSCVVDAGYMYDFSNGGLLTDVKSEYTMAEIQNIKSISKKPVSWEFITGVNADNITTRLDLYCWDILNGIGLLTNRSPFFYDKAYFVDYCTDSNVSSNNYQLGHGTDPSVLIEYGGNGESKSRTIDGVTTSCYAQPMTELAENDDQGSQYLIQSQKVFSENYTATIVISDATVIREGSDIKYLYPETTTASGNTVRNYQTKYIALNAIIRNFYPGDCVYFTTSESSLSSAKYVVKTYADMNSLTTMSVGDTCCVTEESVYDELYRYDGTTWVDIGLQSYLNPIRTPQYNVYSVASYVIDEQNSFTIKNAPLAFTKITYPDCLTSYMFGEPEFIDTEQQISSVEKITQDSVLDKTDDVGISDKYSAKLVFGNQSLEELQDDRSGFTGLIMEKNWTDHLYRLSGYNNGELQAYFNTNGEIMSGDGNVHINERGIQIYNGAIEIVGKNYVEYTTSGSSKLVDTNTYNVTSSTTSGTARTVIDGSGFATYNASGYKQCSMDTDGNIIAGGGAVRLSSSGLRTYDSSKTNRYLHMDGTGITAYNNGSVIWKTSTSSSLGQSAGSIIVGAGNVSLGDNGMTISTSSGYISQNAIKFNTGTTNVANLYVTNDGGARSTVLEAKPTSSSDNTTNIQLIGARTSSPSYQNIISMMPGSEYIFGASGNSIFTTSLSTLSATHSNIQTYIQSSSQSGVFSSDGFLFRFRVTSGFANSDLVVSVLRETATSMVWSPIYNGNASTKDITIGVEINTIFGIRVGIDNASGKSYTISLSYISNPDEMGSSIQLNRTGISMNGYTTISSSNIQDMVVANMPIVTYNSGVISSPSGTLLGYYYSAYVTYGETGYVTIYGNIELITSQQDADIVLPYGLTLHANRVDGGTIPPTIQLLSGNKRTSDGYSAVLVNPYNTGTSSTYISLYRYGSVDYSERIFYTISGYTG